MKNFKPHFPWFQNVDVYLIRKGIFGFMERSLPYFSGKVLDVGCGYMPYRDMVSSNGKVTEYIGMDLEDSEIYNQVKADLYWDGYKIPLQDNSVNTVLLTEVLEHCPNPGLVLDEIRRILIPGGRVIFSVPFIWYLHEVPFDFYRYTPYAITKMFGDRDFTFLSLETYGNNNAAFLHAYFIWLKTGSLPKILRFGIYLATLPLILPALLLSGKNRNDRFGHAQMFIGITGIAEKK